MMISHRQADFFRDGSEFVQAFSQKFPLLFRVVRFVRENSFVELALNAVALLGDVAEFRAHGVEEFAVRDKIFFDLLVRLSEQKRTEPRAGDAHAAKVESLFEDVGVFGIFAADFAAGEARQRHLADALFKSIFLAEVGHVVVSPRNRRDTQFNFSHLKPSQKI